MKRIFVLGCIFSIMMSASVNARSLTFETLGSGRHDLTRYEFIFPLKVIEMIFDEEIKLNNNCRAQVLLNGEVYVKPRKYSVENWHNTSYTREQGSLLLDFDYLSLPLGQTYTLRLDAGSVADLEDATIVNEELNFTLTVPENLNHFFDEADPQISGDSPKICTGCRVSIGTEVESIYSPIIYLKRNGVTIGEYNVSIRIEDWDFSSCQAYFPAVTLDEGAEYTLVLPANSCYSIYRGDLTNDELTFVIQEGSSAITEVELTDSDRNQPIYDLTGRRVLNPDKGLYIINGRKTLLR
ncbi:MAG: hypothetical protein E7082_08675 [Bacteroidales bacterium]|nr:hypothetical protein [Bacteroidales bacterium]